MEQFIIEREEIEQSKEFFLNGVCFAWWTNFNAVIQHGTGQQTRIAGYWSDEGRWEPYLFTQDASVIGVPDVDLHGKKFSPTWLANDGNHGFIPDFYDKTIVEIS